MPELQAQAATRAALLELRDERRLVHEGYELLDEKRMLLAAETLRRLRVAVEAQRQLDADWDTARQALAAAIGVHGFDDLTVEPPCPLDEARLHLARSSFLGLELQDAHFEDVPCRPAASPVRDTPELRRCAAAFRRCVAQLVEQAARHASLRRLVAEYRRTERRARALENVLLPELDESLHVVEEQLDALDQEEAVRVRNAVRPARA
jgi:V/A-type H+-transporting ATPase subunit D